MNSRTIDVVTDWETVAAPDGYEGLHQLAEMEFSGAVSAGVTWAFFLNGRAVGIFEGEIADFEDAELTAYRAADPSLPLLFSMRERGGETQAKYYTNETPLSDVDQTLSQGGFTGYIELSENVLSGDYYVVYHGGKSMSVAFVGSANRLVTGEEAFEKADDEVGIYEVVDVDVDVVDIPEPETTDGTAETDEAAAETDEAAAETGVTSDAADDAPEADAPEADAPEADAGPSDDREDGAETGGTPPDAGASAAADDANADGSTADEPAGASAEADPGAETDPDAESDAGDTGATDASASRTGSADPTAGQRVDEGAAASTGAASAGTASAGPASAGAADSASAATAADSTPSTAGGESVEAAGAATAGEGVFSDEERWREAKTIPSLDPDESSSNGSTDDATGAGSTPQSARERAAQVQRQRTERTASRRQSRQSTGRSPPESGRSGDETQTRKQDASPSGADGPVREGVEQLREELAAAREEIEELETERDELAAERDRLENERDTHRDRIEELEAERDELRTEVERLESRLEDAAAGAGDAAAETERSMAPDEALSGTNLFVRYERKGEATLEHAHDGDVSRQDVDENLRLEHHTTFETDGLAVEGRPYEEFLHDSTEYAFAEWVVTDLIYEIGETGNRNGLSGVFDAIPEIDRVEIRGTVDTETDDGVEGRGFDVIFRDQMGDPLFVSDLNASRNATTEAMVESLVQNAGFVAEHEESLGAGFYVTESFYEPGALETVSEETSSGLLSRSKKLSYVKLSRKRGYHLCLVEARNGEFHLNVPDL